MAIDKTEILELAQQISQQIGQDISVSLQKAVQEIKQSVQGSQQEKSSVTESKQEEINSGEAIRAAVVTGVRSWDGNIKYLFDKSQDYDRAQKAFELERENITLSEERAIAAKNRTFQHTESIISLVNAFSHIVGAHDLAKFNSGVSEPLAPNTQDAGNEPD